MGISKELRGYIDNKYNKRIGDIQSEMNKEIGELRKAWTDERLVKCKEIEKKFLSFAKEIAKEIDSIDCSKGSYFSYLVDNSKSYKIYSIGNPPLEMEFSVRKPYEDKINALRSEKEMVLVKLSLQKNFDEINSILAEFGIGF